MKLLIGVENFGKIKNAEIEVSGYSVFVGDNNSGKTLLMQLIYGILHFFEFPNDYQPIYISEIVDKYLEFHTCVITQEDMELINKEINSYLEKTKKKLINKVFQKDIEAERLYVKCLIDDGSMEIAHNESVTSYNGSAAPVKYDKWTISYHGYLKAFFGLQPGTIKSGEILNLLLFSFGIGKLNHLFIPASRTGIQLLYKEFFAQKVDNLIMNGLGSDNNHLGLTIPVYDFLKFLQTYKPDPTNNKEVTAFIEEKIISGRLSTEDIRNIEYIPQGSDLRVPLYLASSMVNELSPLIMALTTGTHCDTLFIDEAETSLHPKKQREMARLLNRISNLGTHLIVSTHSDTMAAYINLLALVSNKYDRAQIDITELGLEQDDILHNTDIRFYQFSEHDNSSSVEELPFSVFPDVGVDFELFNESLDQLYSFSRKVMEV